MFLLIGLICGFMAGRTFVLEDFNLTVLYTAVSLISVYLALRRTNEN